MNYYQARERVDADGKPTGIWDWTRRNDEQVWAHGYCAGWHEWTADDFAMYPLMAQPERYAELARWKDKYHTHGHASAAEAAACYREYLLDHARYDGAYAGMLVPCQVCGKYTGKCARTDRLDAYALCDAHLNRDGLAQLLGMPTQVVSSM